MIKTGIDIIQISRVAGKVKNNNAFLDVILTENEKNYCNSKTGSILNDEKRFQTVAGIYAVKESFFKALGRGIHSLSDFKSIEVCHKESGQPYLKVLNSDVICDCDDHIKDISISISHDGNSAVAITVIET